MKWAIVTPNNIVRNIIVYDGKSPLDAPVGMRLEKINTWVDINQHISTPEPQPVNFDLV